MTIPPPTKAQLETIIQAALNRDPVLMDKIRELLGRGVQFRLQWELKIEPAQTEIDEVLGQILQAFEQRETCDAEAPLAMVNRIVKVYCQSREAEAASGSGTADNDEAAAAVIKVKITIAHRVLKHFRPRHRRALVRYYAGEETESEICKSLGLTAAQFQGIRPKARELYRQLAGRPVSHAKPRLQERISRVPARQESKASFIEAAMCQQRGCGRFLLLVRTAFRALSH